MYPWFSIQIDYFHFPFSLVCIYAYILCNWVIFSLYFIKSSTQNKTSGLECSQDGHYPDWAGHTIISVISWLPTVRGGALWRWIPICLWQIIPKSKFLYVLLLLSLRQSRLINSEHHDGTRSLLNTQPLIRSLKQLCHVDSLNNYKGAEARRH